MVEQGNINLKYFLEKFNLKQTSVVNGKVMLDDNFFVLTAAILLLIEKLENLRISLLK